MTLIDPNDDSLLRFIVWHHRFDEDRHGRRLVAVRAFSTWEEASDHMSVRQSVLVELQNQGLADLHEYFTCGSRGPGDKERAAYDRITVKKMRSRRIDQDLTKDQIGGPWFLVNHIIQL